MKYAVIKLNGEQFKVEEKDKIKVNHLSEGEKPEAEVLLLVDEEKMDLGKPVVKEGKVQLKVLEALSKGKKINILKYKAKSRYRKHIGFRPQFSTVEVEKISFK